MMFESGLNRIILWCSYVEQSHAKYICEAQALAFLGLARYAERSWVGTVTLPPLKIRHVLIT